MRSRSTPVVTYGIIALCVLVFALQVVLSPQAEKLFIQRHALIPFELLHTRSLGALSTLISHMFMHGGFLHIIGNVWFLYIFGDNVEDNLGRPRFILFYVLCGLGAAAAQILVNPSSQIPMIGASGAIGGVLGAYLTLYPRARITTLIPIFIFIQFAEIPAVWFIMFWFAYQILMGLGSLGQQGGGVAFFAHMGGFVMGLILVRFLRRTRNPTEGWRKLEHGPYRNRGPFDRD